MPLTPEMKTLLPLRRLDAFALVYEAAGGSSYDCLGRGAWDEARKMAGHPKLRLHHMRDTVATELDELGDRRSGEGARHKPAQPSSGTSGIATSPERRLSSTGIERKPGTDTAPAASER